MAEDFLGIGDGGFAGVAGGGGEVVGEDGLEVLPVTVFDGFDEVGLGGENLLGWGAEEEPPGGVTEGEEEGGDEEVAEEAGHEGEGGG